MTGLTLLVLAGGIVAGVGAAAAAVAVLVARNRERRNRVVPDEPTTAPSSWAGAHTPLARLHRRLIAAVQAARAVPDPDGSLIAARVEVEQAALAVDAHLVALDALSERERASRMAQATAAVASVEEAAAKLTDVAAAAPGRAMPAVESALERARLVAEAREELDASPTAILDDSSIDGTAPTLPDDAGASQRRDAVSQPQRDETAAADTPDVPAADDDRRQQPGTA